jgi:rhodanese-related sulfurtransferase
MDKLRITSAELVARARAKIAEIAPEAAKDLWAAGETVFVDLRDPRERQRSGTIPGSFSCPRGMLEFWVDPESPYFKPIFAETRGFVFFCASGWRSALAVATLAEMGFVAAHLGQGFTGWQAAGGAVEPVA